jgi:hypothetical protein
LDTRLGISRRREKQLGIKIPGLFLGGFLRPIYNMQKK